MLNNISVMGRLTADPEVRQTPNGVSVCSFTIANDKDFKRDGDAPNWIDCVAWNGIAETISRHFHKGDRVGVEGKLTTRTWEGRNGKVKATEVVVSNITFLSAKPKTTKEEAEAPVEILDEDLPFE